MRKNRTSAIANLLCLALVASGCMFKEVRRQHELSRQLVRIEGTVALAEPAAGPRVVVLAHMRGNGSGEGDIIDHYSRRDDGSFSFVVTEPGGYAVVAFHDRNGDLTYDPDEPGLDFLKENTFEIGRGATQEGIELVIEPSERIAVDGPADVENLIARSVDEQLGVSLGQLTTVGEIFALGDERFGAASGKLGLWRPLEFVAEFRPGIFFLEPYDPNKIPVLLIHGATGHPNEFGFIVDHLDAATFQPWFYFYPSGGALTNIVRHLEQVVMRLHAQYGFDRLFVVAHSMGGLVGRGFVLSHEEAGHDRLIPLLVTLSAPWGGHAAAQAGVERAPAVVDSWRDMAPDSEYLRKILYLDPETKRRPRELPDHVAYHLFFGFKRDPGSRGASSDSVIEVASQLHPVAQADAEAVFGFDTTHAGILRDAAAVEKLNRILEDAAN